MSDKHLGNFYTPEDISSKMIDEINFENINKDTKILEPSVGQGSIYFLILDRLLETFTIDIILENILYAVELNPDDYFYITNKLNSDYQYTSTVNTKLFNADFLFLDLFVEFDIIIGNPPYVSFKNIFNENMERKEYIALLTKKYNQVATCDLYVYFFMKTFDLLKKNGQQIFICSDSWLASKFGQKLRDKFLTLNLLKIISSPYDYFFDLGTNAIITVIENKSYGGLTKVYYDGFELYEELNITSLIENNLRNIILFPNVVNLEEVYEINSRFQKKLGDYFFIEKSNLTFNKINKEKYLMKIFYQDQSRSGKQSLYKNEISENELSYSSDDIKYKDYVKPPGVYLSGMWDRLPLIFWTEYETIHVSKYYYLNTNIDKKLLYFLILNPLTFLNAEIYLKESTNRSHRKTEKGFAKEINNKLLDLKTIDLSEVDKSIIDKMHTFIKSNENVIEFSVENLYKNKDYIEIIKLLFPDDYDYLLEKSLMLYYKRMRNIKFRY